MTRGPRFAFPFPTLIALIMPIVLVVLVVMTSPTATAQGKEGSMQQTFEFDIASLPLVDALDRYTILTGRPTLYPTTLVAERRGAAVHGRLDAGSALRMLLQGTGIAVKEIHDGGTEAFALVADSVGIEPITDLSTLAPVHVPSAVDDYDALVQRRAWEKFCSDRLTAPGSYRALLRFNIDNSGRVARPRLLGSTGSARLDRLLPAALARLDIGQPPPPGLAQPFTMLVLPQGQQAGQACPAGAH